MSRKHLLSHASGTATRDAQVPMKPEIMLTMNWFCPACSYPLTLTKHMRAGPAYRLFASPLHPGPGTEKRCLENVWGEVDYSEQEEEDPLYVQDWQVVRRHEALGEPGGEQQ